MSEKVDEIAVSAQLNKRLKKILDVRLESDKVHNKLALMFVSIDFSSSYNMCIQIVYNSIHK